MAHTSLTKHGAARAVDKQECHDLLQQAYEHNLVQFGENVREQVNFICNCCGCCCEAMIAARRFAILNPVHTTNFIPVVDEETCNGCSKCVNVCPGISMGNLLEKPLTEIMAGYDPDNHPIVGPLLAGGPAELVERYALPHKRAYADACHLCYESRCKLRERFPDVLTPGQMYGVSRET